MHSEIAINLQDEFPHLDNAPIVEAAVDLRARVGVAWEEASIVPALKSKVPDYPTTQSFSELQQEFTLRAGVVPEGRTIDTGWSGLRCASADGLQIAQFNRNGFVFSRLRPYEEWERLIQEAMRLWNIFLGIARPMEVQRLGLRFINRMPAPPGEVRIEDYFEPAPKPPRALDVPCRQFFYSDTLTVPAYPYLINRIRTMQGSQPDGFAFILDIDVHSTEPIEPRQDLIDQRLADMRWLKNKVFFGSVTERAVEKFK